jgi:hypothetical protein
LVEFSWYFIKSTDRIAHDTLQSFELCQLGPTYSDADQYTAEISMGPTSDWIITFRAKLPSTLFSNEKIPDWIDLEVSSPIITRAEWLKLPENKHKEHFETYEDEPKDGFLINGTLQKGSLYERRFVEIYFSIP